MSDGALASGRASAAAWRRALIKTATLDLLPRIVARHAAEAGEAIALVEADGVLSYAALAARANQYARWAQAHGVAQGGVVALMMSNCADYVAAWLGVTQVGGVAALINPHLRADQLEHALRLADPRLIIAPQFEDVVGATPFADRFAAIAGVAGFSTAPLAAHEQPAIQLDDRALLIYTSGTTGLPKAAIVSHRRIATWALWFAGMMDADPRDRLYDCLPMHHSIGGVVAIGAMLASGGSVAIAPSFSARRFWRDVAAFECTIVQYIGEICRYLLDAPHDPCETRHTVRLACGAGMREDVWRAFQARFAAPRILEFYASTEGNFSLFNAEGEPGSIGRVPTYLAHRFPLALVAFDAETQAPWRGADGFCRLCEPGGVGEAIARISRSARFEGYSDPRESDRKVMRDVFAPGDAWLRTGDLMRCDARGFYYFVDRVGDTFRWKGEMISTLEVAQVLARCRGVRDAIVYGVRVPGAEGRAGMAALVVDDGFEIARFHVHAADALLAAARPVFLRLVSAIALTPTYKPRVVELASQGFDPRQIADALYVIDHARNAYAPLDAALHEAIQSGRRRL